MTKKEKLNLLFKENKYVFLCSFKNNYKEKFTVFQKPNNPDLFFITGDEFGWKLNVKLVMTNLLYFTAISGNSYGFWFNQEEQKALQDYFKVYFYTKDYKGKTRI